MVLHVLFIRVHVHVHVHIHVRMYNFFLLRYSNISITFYNSEEIIAMFNNISMAVLIFIVQHSIIRYM